MTAQMPDRPPLAMAVIPYPMPEAMRNEVPGVTGDDPVLRKLHDPD